MFNTVRQLPWEVSSDPDNIGAGQTGRVLIAEDDDDIRGLLAYRLQKEGFMVIQAEDGKTALGIVEKDTPDLILLDIMMPEMDGWEVCRKIRGQQDRFVATVPVVMLTALSDPKDRLMGLERGADAFLSKTSPLNEVLLYCRNFILLRRKYLALINQDKFKTDDFHKDVQQLLLHELKNHLSVIGGMSAFLSRTKGLAAKERELVNHISKSSNYLEMIANDLKLLGEIEKDEGTGPVGNFDLNELLESVVALQRSFAEKRMINVSCHFFADTCPVQLNETVVKIVVAMILENALKYSHTGAVVHICSFRAGNIIKLTITDNGPGIEASEQGLIFEKKYRARAVRQNKPGTGLGLYLAKILTEMVGGEISALSSPGAGSKFTVIFREPPAII